jgi:Cu2+-exporting ATPase
LVVSCPCALSLATPAALAAAAGALGRRRILAVRDDALEAMARITHVVLDKTGTLTYGRVRLSAVLPLANEDRAACIAIAAALEVGSVHPIAHALRTVATSSAVALDIIAASGSGVEGIVGGRRYRLGRPAWVAGLHHQPLPTIANAVALDAVAIALGDESRWLAWLMFADTLRPGARALIEKLHAMGITVSLVSGDRSETVRHVAEIVGLATYRGGAGPDDKLARIKALQSEGAVVAMVGDGINDAPSLAQANVSLSFGSAATLTQWTADVVVLGDDLQRIGDAIVCARRTFRVIRQNLAWALAYNLVAIPLAATGHLTPLAATLGMSLSSLLVVANALRLLRGDAANTQHDTASSPIVAAGR